MKVVLKLPWDIVELYRAWAKFIGKSPTTLMRKHLKRTIATREKR